MYLARLFQKHLTFKVALMSNLGQQIRIGTDCPAYVVLLGTKNGG